MNDYMNDCIHLHACRLQRKCNKFSSMHCNDRCNAYCNNEDTDKLHPLGLYTYEDCRTIMYGVISDVEYGNTDLRVDDYV